VWLEVLTYLVFGVLIFFGIKTILYDFPLAMESNTLKQYLVNVLIIIVVIGILCGYGYLVGGWDS
jgi:hypothetical protein